MRTKDEESVKIVCACWKSCENNHEQVKFADDDDAIGLVLERTKAMHE